MSSILDRGEWKLPMPRHLNEQQYAAAQVCLEARPPVFPGSRAVINEVKCKAWYDLVCETMDRLGVREPLAIAEFCDVAGVPD